MVNNQEIKNNSSENEESNSSAKKNNSDLEFPAQFKSKIKASDDLSSENNDGLTNSLPAQFKFKDGINSFEEAAIQSKVKPVQRKENKTGLPNNLKSGMENLSGMSLDDVKVHSNSSKPAQFQAHAYAQGSDIHLGPGQEKHLPHELGHVVQQKQGKVQPTKQLKGNVNINDNPQLEKEADFMGNKAIKNYNSITLNSLQEISDNSTTKQLISSETMSSSFDASNDITKIGTGGAALAEGANASSATVGGGVFSDLFDGANAFKNMFEAGSDFWNSNPKDWGAGANAFFEGSKGIMAVVKGSIDASGATQAVKDSAGTWIPGIGAAISAFQNYLSLINQDTTMQLVDGLDKGVLTKGEKQKVSSFVKRLDSKMSLTLVDFIWDIAEVVATFGGPAGPAVALIHSCYNIFKGVCELVHGYFSSKGLQADQRVSGGDGDVNREEMKSLDLHLKDSKKTEKNSDGTDKPSPSKSIFDMIKLYGSIEALKLKISAGAQQTPVDNKALRADRVKRLNNNNQLKNDLIKYNTTLKPDNMPDLEFDQIPNLYKIHMNVIRQIINQSKAGAHGYAKLKSLIGYVKKDEIVKALQTKLPGFNFDDDTKNFELLSNLDQDQASYFEQKNN
jgi:hypothetical protein